MTGGADKQVLLDTIITTGQLASRKSSTQSIAAAEVTPRNTSQNTTTGVTMSTDESTESGVVPVPGNAQASSSSGTTVLLDESSVCVMGETDLALQTHKIHLGISLIWICVYIDTYFRTTYRGSSHK